jgi:hypothetical protein
MEAITEKERFYGYIIGLQIERTQDVENPGPRLYATFEYGNGVATWEVQDAELFSVLSSHLVSMAKTRMNTDDYGYDKLWIKKVRGKWVVELP